MATKTKIEKRLSKPEKVTNEELNKIQTLVGDMNKGQFNLGNLELQKHRILHESMIELKNDIGKIKKWNAEIKSDLKVYIDLTMKGK